MKVMKMKNPMTPRNFPLMGLGDPTPPSVSATPGAVKAPPVEDPPFVALIKGDANLRQAAERIVVDGAFTSIEAYAKTIEIAVGTADGLISAMFRGSRNNILKALKSALSSGLDKAGADLGLPGYSAASGLASGRSAQRLAQSINETEAQGAYTQIEMDVVKAAQFSGRVVSAAAAHFVHLMFYYAAVSRDEAATLPVRPRIAMFSKSESGITGRDVALVGATGLIVGAATYFFLKRS